MREEEAGSGQPNLICTYAEAIFFDGITRSKKKVKEVAFVVPVVSLSRNNNKILLLK